MFNNKTNVDSLLAKLNDQADSKTKILVLVSTKTKHKSGVRREDLWVIWTTTKTN